LQFTLSKSCTVAGASAWALPCPFAVVDRTCLPDGLVLGDADGEAEALGEALGEALAAAPSLLAPAA